MLAIRDLTYRIGDRVLLEDANITIPDGHRIGLVGRNGAGKTTLFNLIAGELSPTIGEIKLFRKFRLGRVAQEAPGGPETLIDTVLVADEERSRLLAEADMATDAQRIADIQTRLIDIDAHSASARAAIILAGLGFTEDEQNRPCSEFSGGWRMRVALAAALFAEPDLLLLDEPTNYLDLEGAMWLEGFLRTYPRGFLVISHDRDMLNRSVDHILHLEHRKLTLYTGSYDRFEKLRREKMAHSQAMAARHEAQRAHMQAFVDRFRAQATKARQAQSRLKALERLQPIVTLIDETVTPIRLPEPENLSPPLLTITGGVTGYDRDNPVLCNLILRIDQEDRIAVLGKNGNGKSTLAKLLSNRLELFSGDRVQSRKLRIGYFAQHQVDDLRAGETAIQHMTRLMPDAPPGKVRTALDKRGFGADKADTKVDLLSGGEKARLLLALVTFNAPHLLILDEPTNHLDIDTRESLVHALNEYSGAVILISHDTHLVETVCDQLWLVADGKVVRFDNDLDAYRRFVLQKPERNWEKAAKAEKPAPKPQQHAAPGKSVQALKRMATRAEVRIANLQKKIADIDKKLADPKIYKSSPAKAAEWARLRAEGDRRLAEAENEWLIAGEALEQADQ